MVNGLESILFNNETTYRTDFSDGEIIPSFRTTYCPKPKLTRIKPCVLKDIHTMSAWNKAIIPFDLFGKLKEVVRTNPRQVQQIYTLPPDLEKEHVRKKCPRLVLTPAVSLDDAPPERRNILVSDTYLTTARAKLLGVSPIATCTLTTPAPELPAPANPIVLSKWRAPFVSPEWRMDSAAWDGRQLRADCDPRKEFYLTRPLTCSVCQDPAPPSREIK